MRSKPYNALHLIPPEGVETVTSTPGTFIISEWGRDIAQSLCATCNGLCSIRTRIRTLELGFHAALSTRA